MRLIDADAKVTVQSFDPMNEEYYHNEMTVEQALDFATDEGCPLFICAIPIAWIDKKITGYASQLRSHELDSLVTVKNMWEKDLEVGNGTAD